MISIDNAKELAPCVLFIEDAIDNSDEIIKKAKGDNPEEKASNAGIFSPFNENISREDLSIRNTQNIDISPSYNNDVFWWLLAQQLWKYGDIYGKKYSVSFSSMETPQFLWYKKNKGFYKPHVDTGVSVPRVFSLVLYLNDVPEGGETHFEHFNISVKPKKNSLILFPANFAYLHGAKKPLSNDKFAVVTWFQA